MGYEESRIEGRNAVLEAFRSGKTIDKLFVLEFRINTFTHSPYYLNILLYFEISIV